MGQIMTEEWCKYSSATKILKYSIYYQKAKHKNMCNSETVTTEYLTLAVD